MKILTFISVNLVLLVLPAIGQVNYDYAAVAEKKIKSATVHFDNLENGYDSLYFRIIFDQSGRIVAKIASSKDKENAELNEINYDSLGNMISRKRLRSLCTNRDNIFCDTLYFEMEEYDNRGRMLVYQKIVKELNSEKKFVNRNEVTEKSTYYGYHGKCSCWPDSVVVTTSGNAKFSDFRYYTYNENRDVLLFHSLKKDENGLIFSSRVDTFFYDETRMVKCVSNERRIENGLIIQRNVEENFDSKQIYLTVLSDGKVIEERNEGFAFYRNRFDIFESRHIVCYEMSERWSVTSYLDLLKINRQIEYEYYEN